jgi:hypothetical protein
LGAGVGSRDKVDLAIRHLRHVWAGSRAYRIVLVAALVYALARLVVHGVYLAMMLCPSSGIMGGMPEWTGAEGQPMVPVDLQIYVDAAERFREHRPLYLRSNRIEIYQYPPLYALAFIPFLFLPPVATVIIQSLLHVFAYLLLYLSWDRIFHSLGLERAQRVQAGTIPIWLVFSSFWSDLSYLNVYVIMALLSTLFIAALLKEQLGWSTLWLTLIVQIKPHWAFPAALPLLLGRYRFFLRLLALAALLGAIVVGTAMLVGGPRYVWEQHVDYVQFLPHVVEGFPWRSPDSDFLGYNHSIKQVIFYLFGVSSRSRRLATGIKTLLLAPLGIIGWRCLSRSRRTPLRRVPESALDLGFALYLGVFIWLDMVWEASLTIAIFAYLLSTLDRPLDRILTWVVFLPYALVDVWQVVSLGLFGMDVIAPGPYVLTDPSIYVPMIMIVILTFYVLLIRRAWRTPTTLLLAGAKA